jgi:hypothetical protein
MHFKAKLGQFPDGFPDGGTCHTKTLPQFIAGVEPAIGKRGDEIGCREMHGLKELLRDCKGMPDRHSGESRNDELIRGEWH